MTPARGGVFSSEKKSLKGHRLITKAMCSNMTTQQSGQQNSDPFGAGAASQLRNFLEDEIFVFGYDSFDPLHHFLLNFIKLSSTSILLLSQCLVHCDKNVTNFVTEITFCLSQW